MSKKMKFVSGQLHKGGAGGAPVITEGAVHLMST